MSLFSRWRRPTLAPDEQQRLEALLGRAPPGEAIAPAEAQWVVADVESTGLDLSKDRLIAIGAVRVSATRLRLDDAFHVVLRQAEASSAANILVHRITDAEQLGGGAPVDALLGFREYVGDAHLVGFRAPFDESMIGNAERTFLGRRVRRTWLDLAYLAPALGFGTSGRRVDLDDLLARLGIEAYERHDALADAVATAQLLLVLLDAARAQGVASVGALRTLAEAERWLQQAR